MPYSLSQFLSVVFRSIHTQGPNRFIEHVVAPPDRPLIQGVWRPDSQAPVNVA